MSSEKTNEEEAPYLDELDEASLKLIRDAAKQIVKGGSMLEKILFDAKGRQRVRAGELIFNIVFSFADKRGFTKEERTELLAEIYSKSDEETKRLLQTLRILE